MICPHCLKTIDDSTTFCPYCHGYVRDDSARDFVFCEGCGARLSIHDRTCPKCGRPAPGILSAQSSSSDLAAGRTASFPRLTKHLIQTEGMHPESLSAARALDDSVDPSDTNVLERDDLEQESKRRRRRASSTGEDPYHPHKRSYGKLLAGLFAVAVVLGSVGFVYYDPLGLMPGFYQWFQQAASEAFPSRQVGLEDQVAADGNTQQAIEEDAPPTDEELYIQLSSLYDQIVSFDSAEAIGEVIDSFNSWYLASDHDVREQRSMSAYSLRDAIQQTIDDIDSIVLPEGSAYTETVDHLRQLAEWMYGRVNQICEAWDVSLAVPEGESVSAREDGILAPLRSAGSSDLDNFDTYAGQWQPLPPEEAAAQSD